MMQSKYYRLIHSLFNTGILLYLTTTSCSFSTLTTTTQRRRRQQQQRQRQRQRQPPLIPTTKITTAAVGVKRVVGAPIQTTFQTTSSSYLIKNHHSSFPISASNSFNQEGEQEPNMTTKTTSTKTTTTKTLITKIGSTTSTVVAGTFFIALSYKRDTFMITFFIGSIINGITSKILKRLLKQDRPNGYTGINTIKPSDNGMPSSHAMSLGFIGTFTTIELYKNLMVFFQKSSDVAATSAATVTATVGATVGGFGSLGSLLFVYGVCSLLWIYVAISLIYRVQSQLHTKEQVWVGLIGGTTNALLWKSLAQGTNTLFPTINIMHLVSTYLLPADSGILPVQWLIVPAIIGAAVVGSFERRISNWWKNRSTAAGSTNTSSNSNKNE